jgi:hypothetical protein
MQLNFDAATVDPFQGSSVRFPLADYPLEIIKTEGKPVTDNPNKGMLVLTCRVLDGPMKGQDYHYRFNLYNDNETTVRIAYQQLSAVCHVTGRLRIGMAEELIGGRFIATIGPQDKEPKYDDVKKVTDMAGNPPTRGQAPQQAPQTAAPAYTQQPAPAANAAPWGAAPAAAQSLAPSTGFQAPAPGNGAPPWAASPNAAVPPWGK